MCLVNSVRTLAGRFFVDQCGGAALILGLILVPALLGIGLAIDAGRGYYVQSKLQDAVDAAALASARDLYDEENAAIELTARRYFDANYPDNFLGGRVDLVQSRPDQSEGIVEVTAKAQIPTTFMTLADIDEVSIEATATASVGARQLELALVLDYSESMQWDGRFATLVESIDILLNSLYREENEVDGLAVSIVPYKGMVNISASRTGWLADFDPDNYEPDAWAGCIDARTAPFDQDDTPPTIEPFDAFFWPAGRSTGSANNSWPPVNTAESGPNLGCNQNTILSLTTKRDVIEAALESYSPTTTYGAQGGNTNSATGMVWGWRTLSPRWQEVWGEDVPEDRPSDYDESDVTKMAVLMTDGRTFFGTNVRNAYGFRDEGRLGSTDKSVTEQEIERRLLSICSAMKSAGIVVYTIVFRVDDEDIESAYRNCASSTDTYSKAETNAELIQIFDSIADNNKKIKILD